MGYTTWDSVLEEAKRSNRPLFFMAVSPQDRGRAEKTLQPIFANGAIMGRFHLDFGTAEADSGWSDKIAGTRNRSGYFIIQADEFGQKGKAVAQFPLTSSGRDIAEAILSANKTFAKTEVRKVYSEHVTEGRREDIFFENQIPYGEDRDGDGIADGRRYGKGRE